MEMMSKSLYLNCDTILQVACFKPGQIDSCFYTLNIEIKEHDHNQDYNQDDMMKQWNEWGMVEGINDSDNNPFLNEQYVSIRDDDVATQNNSYGYSSNPVNCDYGD